MQSTNSVWVTSPYMHLHLTLSGATQSKHIDVPETGLPGLLNKTSPIANEK